MEILNKYEMNIIKIDVVNVDELITQYIQQSEKVLDRYSKLKNDETGYAEVIWQTYTDLIEVIGCLRKTKNKMNSVMIHAKEIENYDTTAED